MVYQEYRTKQEQYYCRNYQLKFKILSDKNYWLIYNFFRTKK
jgi:hypothetical protein